MPINDAEIVRTHTCRLLERSSLAPLAESPPLPLSLSPPALAFALSSAPWPAPDVLAPLPLPPPASSLPVGGLARGFLLASLLAAPPRAVSLWPEAVLLLPAVSLTSASAWVRVRVRVRVGVRVGS